METSCRPCAAPHTRSPGAPRSLLPPRAAGVSARPAASLLALAALLSAGLLSAGAATAASATAQAATPQRPPAGTAGTAAPVPAMFGGVQINEPDHDRWVGALAGVGLNAVQVMLYARQGRWDRAELSWDRESPWVVSEIRAARRAGLRVALVMRVALEHGLAENRHLWHGMIWPRAEELEAWLQRYRAFVLQGARLAAAEGIDLFALGNELTSLTSTRPVTALPDLYAYYLDPARVAAVDAAVVRCAEAVRAAGGGADLVELDGGRYATLAQMLAARARVRRDWALAVVGGDPGDLRALNQRRRRLERFWRDLIADVRELYHGAVTYGANFDQFDQVGFWDALDAVGVDAYFPLGRYGLPLEQMAPRLRAAWRRTARQLQAVSPALPVVLLELGWTRWRGSTVRPYSYDRVEVLETGEQEPPRLTCVHWPSQPEDARERVAAIEALRDVVAQGGFRALRGAFLWKLTTRAQQRAIEPFAVLVDPRAVYPDVGWSRLGSSDLDALDRIFLRRAAEIAERVVRRVQAATDATPPGRAVKDGPTRPAPAGVPPRGRGPHEPKAQQAVQR